MQSCPSPERCAQIMQAEADYNRLFNLSRDLLCIAGLDGYFKRVNPSWTRVLGWSEAELLAQPVERFMHPEDRERTLQARAGLARGVAVSGLENRYLCKDGSHRWLSWQSITEPSGTTVFCVARDITEQRQVEQERLVLSKLESTGVLAGGIAHDFNNLLAALTLNLEAVAMGGTLTADQQEQLRCAGQAVLSARALTQQLITFADGGAPVRQVLDLELVIRQALDAALAGSTLRGECLIAPGLWPALVDEDQIAHVLRNIILNARDAARDGGTIAVRAENAVLGPAADRERPAGECVRITVQDQGCGIPAELMPRIFDPYFSTKQRGNQKGMGLGLTICRTVVRKHGGTIDVESRPGQGTTVTLHLPARRITGLAEGVAAPSADQPARILVMDDEAMLRDALGCMLPRLGYTVELAEDGQQAIARYEEAARQGRRFQAVLLDLTVRGGMGGRETLAALKAQDPDVNAVLMTGYSKDDAYRRHAELGFRGALAKPFRVETLRGLLAQVLRHGGTT